MTRPPLPLDDQLCFALYGASIAVSRLYKPLLDTLGLTYPQFLVLQTVREGHDPTIGGIAARLSLDPSTVTPVVKRMEAAGLLRRERDPTDERQVRVRLTEPGAALWNQTGCLGDHMAAASGMEMAELGALNRQVRRLQAALATDPGARGPDIAKPDIAKPDIAGQDGTAPAPEPAAPFAAKPGTSRPRRPRDQAARKT